MTTHLPIGRTLWAEDDAPDRERLPEAWARLFGGAVMNVYKSPGVTEDWGDATALHHPSGYVAVSSYPGNDCIYAPPRPKPEGTTWALKIAPRRDPETVAVGDVRDHGCVQIDSARDVWGTCEGAEHAAASRQFTSRTWRGDVYVWCPEGLSEDEVARRANHYTRTAEEVVLDAARDMAEGAGTDTALYEAIRRWHPARRLAGCGSLGCQGVTRLTTVGGVERLEVGGAAYDCGAVAAWRCDTCGGITRTKAAVLHLYGTSAIRALRFGRTDEVAVRAGTKALEQDPLYDWNPEDVLAMLAREGYA